MENKIKKISKTIFEKIIFNNNYKYRYVYFNSRSSKYKNKWFLNSIISRIYIFQYFKKQFKLRHKLLNKYI